MQDRCLIFHPSENGRFITNFNQNAFQWTGEFIGDVTNNLNELPALRGTKLFFIFPACQYVILEKYDTKTHLIHLIKRIYEMNIIPYNLCIYKKKQYFMYQYAPFNEMNYTAFKKNKSEITDDERKIFFLHWILGVKGKTLAVTSYDSNLGNKILIISHGKYSGIDYERNKPSTAAMDKFFGEYYILHSISAFFKNEEKIESIRLLMSNNNYWWFQEIEKRILEVVNIY